MSGGIIPEGIWVLDKARSRKLTPGSVTLWIIRDDGERLVWVGVDTNEAGEISVKSFDGRYGGETAVVRGSGFVVSLSAPGPGAMVVKGEIPNMGPFSETTVVSPDRRQMKIDGEVRVGNEVKTWYEEFNWVGPIPSADEDEPELEGTTS